MPEKLAFFLDYQSEDWSVQVYPQFMVYVCAKRFFDRYVGLTVASDREAETKLLDSETVYWLPLPCEKRVALKYLLTQLHNFEFYNKTDFKDVTGFKDDIICYVISAEYLHSYRLYIF